MALRVNSHVSLKGEMKSYRKKLYSIIFFGTIMLVNFSCQQKTDCCTIIDTSIQILYKNALGENLINSTPDYKEEGIKIYYKNGNKFEYVYNENLDTPNMHRIDEDESGNLILTIYPSSYYEGNQSTTLIELNQNTVDTLVGEFEIDSNREVCKSAWVNGVEMENRFLEIKK